MELMDNNDVDDTLAYIEYIPIPIFGLENNVTLYVTNGLCVNIL